MSGTTSIDFPNSNPTTNPGYFNNTLPNISGGGHNPTSKNSSSKMELCISDLIENPVPVQDLQMSRPRNSFTFFNFNLRKGSKNLTNSDEDLVTNACEIAVEAEPEKSEGTHQFQEKPQNFANSSQDYLQPCQIPSSNSSSSLKSIESVASTASSTSTNSTKSLKYGDLGNYENFENFGNSQISQKTCEKSEKLEEEVHKGFKKYIGLCLTLLSGLLYSLAAILVKLLKDDYHPFMISIWRFQGVFLPSILLVMYRECYKKEKDYRAVWPLKTRDKAIGFTVLMLRGILGCWSVILQFMSLNYLQVSDSMVITSSTSVFVTLLAHCFIGEKCAIVPIITALLTMAGVFVISRPPMLTGQEAFDTDILIGVGMALGCMILAAAILVIQRHLRSSHFSLISLSSGLWGTLQCVILTFAIGVFKLPVSSKDAMYGIALAGLTFFAQSFIVIALKFEQAGPVAVVQSCDVIFAFMWQFAFLGVVPDYFSLIGSLIIIAGLLLTAFRKCLSVLPEDHRSRERFRFLLM